MPLRELDREQMWLLPPNLDELLPADHPARFVAEFVDALDRAAWAELGVEIDGEAMGAPAYHPRAMLSTWLYGFMTNVRSCRKLEAACRDQIPLLWLTGCQRPDHNTLWRFYQRHRSSMRALFKRTVRTAVALELVDLAVQAVDGTKLQANASRERNFSADQLERLMDGVDQAIGELEAQNEGGTDPAPATLPAQLAEQRALREQVRSALDKLDDGQSRKLVNLTDPDAAPMRTRRDIVPGYNAQAVVSPLVGDAESSGFLVTAAEVVDEGNDTARLAPMVEQAEEMTGSRTPLTLADAGYFSGKQLDACHQRGQQVAMPEQGRGRDDRYHRDRFDYDQESDSYCCPHGQQLPFAGLKQDRGMTVRLYRSSSAANCRACPAFGVCTRNAAHGRTLEVGPYVETLRRHREWMATEAAQRAYRRRLPLIEPLFGILKNQLGAQRCSLRGLQGVAAEWTLLVTAFNLRTLWRHWRRRIPEQTSPSPVLRPAL